MAIWLIVEDDTNLLSTLCDALQARGFKVIPCACVAEAVAAMQEGEVEGVVVDIMLPDGDAAEIVERAMAGPAAPAIVAISGVASPSATFRLAQMGVRAFLPKPLRLADLDRAIDDALARPPDLRPHMRAAVGRAPIHKVEEEVRETMVHEAVARSGGNRREAARLLGISRQLLQHILRHS